MNIHSKMKIAFLALAVVHLTGASSSLGNTIPVSQPMPELEWGFSDYPPYKYKENGEYKGIDVLLVNEISAKLGVKIKYYECPFKRCLELMKSGSIDFMTSVGQRDDRKEYVEFIFPPVNENNAKVFYLKKGSGVKIDKYEDVYKYKIGTKIGVNYFPKFDEDTKIKKDAVAEVEFNLKKLNQKRIDAAMNTEIQMDFLIIQMGLEGAFEKAKYREDFGEGFIGVSKNSKFMSRKGELEALVKDMAKSGRLRAIEKEFFDKLRKDRLKSQTK